MKKYLYLSFFSLVIFCQCQKYDYEENSFFIPEGLSRVMKNGFWGLVNMQGEEVVPPKYGVIENFSDGYAVVATYRKYGVINTKGEEIIPLKYDYISGFYDDKNLTKTRLNGKYGYLNTKGEEVIPFLYDDAFGFYEGFAKVKKVKTRK